MINDGGKYNACLIRAMIGCIPERGTGFIYPTSPTTQYDYVLTAKHVLTEGLRKEVDFSLLHSITIDFEDPSIDQLSYSAKELQPRLLEIKDEDLVIIKISKIRSHKVERVLVKRSEDCDAHEQLESYSFPSSINDGFPFMYELRDRDKMKVVIQDEQGNPDKLQGISGSGIVSSNKPYLLGIISLFPYKNMAFNTLILVPNNWDLVNEQLRINGWEELRIDETKYEFTIDRTIKDIVQCQLIDIRDILITIESGSYGMKHSVYLDLVKALRCFWSDMRDDWYFDPVLFKDVCTIDYVSDYFKEKKHRDSFVASPAEVFYIPKNAMVLRKATVGSFIERLIYMAIVERLSSLIEDHLCECVFSARRNCLPQVASLIVPGVEQWKKMLFLLDSWIAGAKDEACLIKVDLLNYYDTIHRDILISSLTEVCRDREDVEAVQFLSTLLDQMLGASKVGLPQNNDASSMLASFYLSKVDLFMKTRTNKYCRFMDDIYFMVNDYYEAKSLMQELEGELRKLNLAVNGQKVKIYRHKDGSLTTFRQELRCDELETDKIESLIRSSVKLQRMKATSILIKQLNKETWSKFPVDPEKRKNRDRIVKYCLRVLATTRFELGSYKVAFLRDFMEVVKNLKNDPEDTNFVLRILSAFGRETDVTSFHKEIEQMLSNPKSGLFEWQSYLLWMYLASVKYKSISLEKYAVDLLNVNSETRKAEIAAIMVYLCSVKKDYCRNVLQQLQENRLHGNLQYRTAIVCSRSLHPIDNYGPIIHDQFVLAHRYLFQNAEMPLVCLYNPVSEGTLNADGGDPLMDIISGL